MRCERGQATVEWVGLLLLASLVLGALAVATPEIGGNSLGAFLSKRIFCAVGGERCRADTTGPGRRLFAGPSPSASVAASGPCTVYSCNPVGSHCTVVYEGRRGRAFCKARAAAEEPSGLTKFLRRKFKNCLVGATGAKTFTPFADELLRKEATKSARHAFRALKKGLRRARRSVLKGKLRPGLVGCFGGTIGL